MIESPPFEVSESGWGEFEVQLKLYFVPEAGEKAQTLWHALKLHPYGDDADGQRLRRDAIVSQNYEEVIFSEPVEAFFDVLTSGPPPATGPRGGKGGAKGAKQHQAGMVGRGRGERSAEVPYAPSVENPYSLKREGEELDRLREAARQVEGLMRVERGRLREREEEMEELRREGGRS